MSEFLFTGRCWQVGDYVPTDQIIKSRRVYLPLEEAGRYVFEDINPAFGQGVRPGDILVAGRHFGQSSGRAVAVKALMATGIACVVAEYFSRTFYRNAFEIGLPILEVPGVSAAVTEGDVVEVDITAGRFTHRDTGKTLTGNPIDKFLLEMLRAGGIIALAPRLVEENRS